MKTNKKLIKTTIFKIKNKNENVNLVHVVALGGEEGLLREGGGGGVEWLLREGGGGGVEWLLREDGGGGVEWLLREGGGGGVEGDDGIVRVPMDDGSVEVKGHEQLFHHHAA